MSARVIQLPRTAAGREVYRKHVGERRAQGLEPATGGDHFDRYAAWLADPQGRDFWREEVQRDVDSGLIVLRGWEKSAPSPKRGGR